MLGALSIASEMHFAQS